MKRKSAALIIGCVILLAACKENREINVNGAPPSMTEAAEAVPTEEADNSAAQGGETKETAEASLEETAVYTEDLRSEAKGAEALPEGLRLAVDGEFISEEDITAVYTYDEGEPYNGVWSYLVCEGAAYIAEPTGVSFNSEENADIFDSDSLTFQGMPACSEAKHKLYHAGDTVCGLTVKSAVTLFDNTYTDSEVHAPDDYRRTSTAELEGSLSLIGYLYVSEADAPNKEYLMGDVFFVPDNESCKLLPFIGGLRDMDKGLWVDGYGDFYWLNEYDRIICGNIYRDDFKFDLSGRDVNKPIKVGITVSDIRMTSSSALWSEINLKIDELDFLQ